MTMRSGIGMAMALTGAVLLQGCVAKAAWNVATLPVKAGSQAVDWTTTSQDEADRNRGREMRRRCEHDRDAEGCERR